MNRCILLGFVGPHVLGDLAELLDGLLVPLLQDKPESVGAEDNEGHTVVSAAEGAIPVSGKPVSAQMLKLGSRLESAPSTDSHLAENESVSRLPWASHAKDRAV